MTFRVAAAAAVVLGCAAGAARAAVLAGDLALVAYNTDAPDNWAVVTTRAIAAGEVVNFTDSSWQGFPGTFRLTEHLSGGGPLVWTTTAMGAGTVIVFDSALPNGASLGTTTGAFPGFSANGDQIFAFQGTNASPNFIFGSQFATSSGTNGGQGIIDSPTVSADTDTTNIPGTLILGSTFQDLQILDGAGPGRFDNGVYGGPTTGFADAAALLAALNDISNWTGNNAAIATGSWPTAFSFAPVPEPSTVLALALVGLAGVGLLRRRMTAGA